VCKLVHGDLSEYNMLWDEAKGGVVIIDVSQVCCDWVSLVVMSN